MQSAALDSRDKVPGRAGRLNTTKMAITFILVLLMGLVLADSACAFQIRRASRHRPSTTLHVLPFGESKAEPQLPKDVKDAISKCRGAVQKGLEVSVLDLRVSLAHCSYFCADTHNETSRTVCREWTLRCQVRVWVLRARIASLLRVHNSDARLQRQSAQTSA